MNRKDLVINGYEHPETVKTKESNTTNYSVYTNDKKQPYKKPENINLYSAYDTTKYDNKTRTD